MLTYKDLTLEQQEEARGIALTNLLTAICEGRLRFNDELNHDNLQTRIDAAGEKAEAMQTPWFWHEYIMDTCREDLEGIALNDAEDASYPEPNDLNVYTIQLPSLLGTKGK